jgi:hypothetical protein
MSRLRGSIGALMLTVVVCAGASTGPAFGDTSAPAEPAATQPAATEPAATEPPEVEPPATEPTETQPIETQPTETPPTETSNPVEPTTAEPPAPAEPSPTEPITITTTTPVAPTDPAAAEPVAESVDLTISVTFDKPVYFADEEVTVRAGVTNVGTASATRVFLDSTGNLSSDYWSGFGYGGSPPIGPGETAEGTLSARVTAADDLLTLAVTARSDIEPDVNPADNTVTVSVPITVVRGTFTGTVYGDRDGNGVMGADEALAGLEVTVRGGRPYADYTATTDSAGRFTFPDLPRGRYEVKYASDEWWFPHLDVDVDGVDDPDMSIRGTPLVNRVLTATGSLDQSTYRLGDTARLALTLANSGPMPLTGITASCWSFGSAPFDLGELAPGGPGVTVPANASRDFVVAISVNAYMVDTGNLYADCTFGAPPHYNGNVIVKAHARVPGGRAPKVAGLVALERPRSGTAPLGPPVPGAPVPNLKVYLKDQFTGAVFVRATTNASGVFEFFDVPAGTHQLGVVGPWEIVYGGPGFPVTASDNGSPSNHLVLLVPGTDKPDPDPAPQPGDPSPPPGTAPPGTAPPGTGPAQQPTAAQLAATGVNVTWLALGGLLTLLAGIGLVTRIGRRRI